MPKQTRSPAKQIGDRPIHQLRHRNIKASIWKNQTAKGPMYDVKIIRSYKEDDVWRDSTNFGFDDLLIVAKLMYDAHSFICAKRAEDQAGVHGTSQRR